MAQWFNHFLFKVLAIAKYNGDIDKKPGDII